MATAIEHASIEDLQRHLRELERENRALREQLLTQQDSCASLSQAIHDVKNVLIELGEAAHLSYGRQPNGMRYDHALIRHVNSLYHQAHPERRNSTTF